ncbi:MAG: hypothetical protein ACI8PQ_000393 [Planctomycetota bacterium]|jgi:hypothetical protein
MLITSLLLGFLPAMTEASVVPGPELMAPAVTARTLQTDSLADLLPAESRYVAHVNVRALLASRLWKELGAGLADLDNNAELNELKNQLGIDPFTDINAVTVFSSSPDEESLGVMVHGTRALRRALLRLDGIEDHTLVEIEGLNVHVFNEGGEDSYLYSHEDVGSEESLIVISPSRTELLRSALVLRGGRRNLAASSAQGEEVPKLAIEPDTIMHVAFTGSIPGFDDGDPVGKVLSMARGGVFSLREFRNNLTMQLGVVTETEDLALEMADAVDGLMSLGAFLLSNTDEAPPEARQLLRSLRVNNDGATVFIDLSYPLDKLIGMASEMGAGR